MILQHLRRRVALLVTDVVEIMSFMDMLVKNIGKILNISETLFVSDLTRCFVRTIICRLIAVERGVDVLKSIIMREVENSENIDNICMGYLVQYGLEKLLQDLGLRKCSNVYRRVISLDGTNIVISGKPDYELEINGKRVPIEVKYTSKIIDRPRPSYVTQCSLYAWLCGSEYCKLLIFMPGRASEHDIPTVCDDFVRIYIRKWISTAPLWKNECDLCILHRYCTGTLRREVLSCRGNMSRLVEKVKNLNLKKAGIDI